MVRTSVICTSPAFAGVIALTGIILSGSPAHAADECLDAPNSSAPTGSHWYYRLERSTQRKCWYVGPEDRQVHAESSKIQPAAKSSGVKATTGEQTKVSRQTERAHTHPTAVIDHEQADSTVWERPEPTAFAAPAMTPADEQATTPRETDLPPIPSAPALSTPDPSVAVVQKSVPASPASFTPIRVLLVIPAALALTGILAFAVFPSRLRRRIYASRGGSNRNAITEQDEIVPRFNKAIATPNLPDAQIHTPDELKQNLRQVLQTLEAQLRGDVALRREALPQRRSRKAALTLG